MLLEQVRGFVLAGNNLPVVWTPPPQLRDDRELVRARIDVVGEIARVKLKIMALLKSREIQVISPTKTWWTKAFMRHMRTSVLPTLDVSVGTKLQLLLDSLVMYFQ